MPLAMLWIWLWAKVFGTSEWALRAANIPWGVAAVIAFHSIGKLLRASWLPLLLVLQPFFWYYMDEARPYAMQIAAGSWLLFALVEYIATRGQTTHWALALSVAGVVLCGSSLLGVIPFCCCCVVLAYPVLWHGWRPAGKAIFWLRICIALLFPIGIFYLWTLLKGAAGARLWPVNYANLFFAVYELAGFIGLGPSRIVLREAASVSTHATTALILPYLPFVLSFAVLYAWVLGRYFSRHPGGVPRRIILASASCWLATLITMFVLAYAAHWPFWGRHLAAILPFQIAVIAGCMMKVKGGRWYDSTVNCLLLVFLAVSAFQVRFGREHFRDDYRAAAALARNAHSEGRTVWWCANAEAALYYRVPLSKQAESGAVIPLMNVSASALAELEHDAPPDLIIYTRANACDNEHALADFIQGNHWVAAGHAPAFTFFVGPR